MPKKKNAMALFEAISKSKAKRSEDMTVPGWVGKSQAPPAGAAGQAGPPATAGTPAVGVPPVAAAPPVPGERSASPVGGGSALPAVGDLPQASQDIVTLSMTRKTAVLIVLGLVLGAAAIFVLGRWSGRPGQAGQPTANIAANGGVAKVEPKPVPPANTDFVKGKYYLVIQDLEGLSERDRADADKIADFCTLHGQPAKVVQFPAGSKKPRFAVWSLRPRDTGNVDDSVKAEVQAVEEIGKEYFKQHKDYDLKLHDKSGRLTAYLHQAVFNNN